MGRKLAINLTIYLGIVYAIEYTVFVFLERVFSDEKISCVCDKASWVQIKKDQVYDYAVIGSSRAVNNLNNKCIDDSLGSHSINLANAGSGYGENFITLYYFLKRNNRIKSLFLQVDGYSLNAETAFHPPFNEQYYMHLLEDDTIAEVVKNYVGPVKYYRWKMIPLLRFMEYNFRYSFYKALKGGYTCGITEYDTLKGFEPLRVKPDSGLTNDRPVIFTVSKIDTMYLGKIISLCERKHIMLVLFTSPEHNEYIKKQVNRKSVDEYYNQLAGENNIRYVSDTVFGDVNKDVTLFKDNTHLTEEGARLYSYLFLPYIKKALNGLE
jgi:hypothetical protein